MQFEVLFGLYDELTDIGRIGCFLFSRARGLHGGGGLSCGLGGLAAVGPVSFGLFEAILERFFVGTVFEPILVGFDFVGVPLECVQGSGLSSMTLVVLGFQLDTLVGILECFFGIAQF